MPSPLTTRRWWLRVEQLDSRDLPSGNPAWAVGAAPGGEPRVWVYDADGQQVTTFLAYESTFTGGVRVAVADLNSDGAPDITTAAGPGGGPRVRVFDGDTGSVLADFMAYDESFHGGVWVAAGPVGNGRIGIATGADAGGGPHVRVFAADGTGLQNFFAFDEAFTGGVRVALGQGAGSGPEVYATNGPGMAPTIRGFDIGTGSQVFEQRAGDDAETGGVWVAAGDLTGDGADEVLTAAGSGSDTELRLFDGANGTWANQATASGTAYGVGIVNWGGQQAVGVLGGSSLSVYTFGADFGDAPTLLGQMSTSGWGGGSGASFGGTAGGLAGTNQDTLTADWVFNISPPETVTVTSTVIKDSPDYPNRYLWKYHVHNNNFDEAIAEIGAGHFVILTDQSDLIADMGNSMGWTSQIGEAGDDTVVKWNWQFGGPRLDPGEEADFWFTTPAMASAVGFGDVRDPGEANRASGTALVPADGPRIVITYPDNTEVGKNGLKVAKWQDAFQMAADGESVTIKAPDTATTNWDFIDRDPDRFNVWVYDKPKWDAMNNGIPANLHIRAKISTTNVVGFTMYNDNPTEVDLVRYTGGAKNENGWFWSDSQMLVSNEVDDKFWAATYLQADEQTPGPTMPLKNGYRWQASDRTHRVALRGTVRAEYTDAGAVTVSASAGVPVTKNVKVHTTILRNKAEADGGMPVISEKDANQAIHNANEQYAQVGILLIPNFQIVNPPDLVKLNDGLQGYSVGAGIILSKEEETLLDEPGLPTAATNDIELYFVNYFTDQDRRGEAFAAVAVPDQKYADSTVISVDDRTPFTTGHEIGHLMLNTLAHYTGTLWPANLMRGWGTSVADEVTASKRLTPGQQADMLTKRPNLLTAP